MNDLRPCAQGLGPEAPPAATVAKIAGTALGLEPFGAGSRVIVEATDADCALYLGGAKGAAIDPNVIRKKRQQHCDGHPSTPLLLPHCEYQQDASAPSRAYGNRISHKSEVSQPCRGITESLPQGLQSRGRSLHGRPSCKEGVRKCSDLYYWGLRSRVEAASNTDTKPTASSLGIACLVTFDRRFE